MLLLLLSPTRLQFYHNFSRYFSVVIGSIVLKFSFQKLPHTSILQKSKLISKKLPRKESKVVISIKNSNTYKNLTPWLKRARIGGKRYHPIYTTRIHNMRQILRILPPLSFIFSMFWLHTCCTIGPFLATSHLTRH